MNNFQKRNELPIPPRWLHCPRKSSPIIDKFVAFKTPLDDRYTSQIPEDCTFPPSMLLGFLALYKIKMGLWIDLTNTSRFYDKKEIEDNGIRYVKLQCRGHGETPSVEQTKTFIHICKQFIAKNPLEYIGVHCTHGFNRTGFLIISYLIDAFDWGVDAAIDCFSQARPPGIYKKDYLEELYRRYGDVNDFSGEPPPLPEWCNEPEDVDDDGMPIEMNGETFDLPPPKRKREFMKDKPVFMEGIPGVEPLTDQKHILKIQRRCQNMCEWQGSGFPGSQPVSMDIHNLNYLTMKPYKVSWKADGTRYMMLIDGENEVYFIDRDNSVFRVHGLKFPDRKAPDKHLYGTLLDGEMIIDKVKGKDVPRYLAYDIIKYKNIEVGKTDFDRRMLCITKEIKIAREEATKEGRLDRCKEPFSIRPKEFYDVTFSKRILEKFCEGLPHEVDGLIFQPVPDPYVSGRCQEVLKWKPPSLNSVDFRLVIGEESGIGIVRAKIGYLYVGGLKSPFASMKCTKAIKDLDKKIIECKYENNQWVFMRERTDKSFPNAYQTAMGVCESIKNPVTTEILFNCIEERRWTPTIIGK